MSNNKKKGSKKTPSKKKLLEEKEIKINELNSEMERLNEKYVKLLAEFDNFQRRTINEKESIKKFQSLDIAKDLLPAIDDLDRTLDSTELKNNRSISEAINMIKSKIEKIFNKHSIESFKSLETDFDPTLHEALLEQYSNSFEKGKVIEEYEKGYKYYDKIIRHAKVVVSKGEEKEK